MQTNLWREFEGLLPSRTKLIGTVNAHNGDDTSTLTLPEGGTLRAIGTSVSIGSKAYVQDGRVLGLAPDLPTNNYTV
ncbi:hypothetical protein [Arenimonas oryziterrae]|uniref:Uncharacterized protein n=1 Tax=Arenimonas oryziterrae DSM 21050 = YC6267 TaxID=1121015 RepID=A0A091BD67_9GAMM|nr:hypothetical protein [Arenimonas oryziterrae]KFN42350.1 hypothetical protein N789_14265 [Arenimonas oryziterrae DSM 21050 = YC6267]